jgi:mannose/cellobiose epimerase-like protein (N-acyl-D-glucosamine 2-epimerase family)
MQTKPSDQWIKATKSRVEKILTKNIMPFWYPATIDYENGGYYLNHDVYSKPLGAGPKMIVSQARMIWYFSKLLDAGWAGKEALQAAEHGFKFLRDKMWDKENGGFFWEVDPQGGVQQYFKHIYGQSYGLYALSEYAIASGNVEALDYARQLFKLMESHAYDETYGGYCEFFNPDWSLPKIDVKTDVAPGMNFKTMNTHLHLLEAFTTYYGATENSSAKQRLTELISILSNTVVRMKVGACTDLHNRDWSPVHGSEQDRISYGHNLEAIWLLGEACNKVQVPVRVLVNYFQTIYDYCAELGFDAEKGGVYDSGPINKPADRLAKTWWVQAETLVTSIYMYRLIKDRAYLEHFDKVLDWTEKYQVDWENGEWFDTVLPDGKPAGNKAHRWKAAYHTGRAMIEVLRLLDQL